VILACLLKELEVPGTRCTIAAAGRPPAERDPKLHRIVLAAAGAALAVLALAAPAAAGSPAVVRADRDGDKVFDDLERRLATLEDSQTTSVIVTLRAPATAERVWGLQTRVGTFALGRRFTIVPAFAAMMSRSDVRGLAALPEVVRVEPNLELRAFNDAAQRSFGVTKARADSGLEGDGDGVPESYSKGDLVAAVLDTGIDANHRDLDEGKVLAFADCAGRPCTLRSPVDLDGHGTHVAATIAGEGDARADRLLKGVVPAAALVGVRVLDASGVGTEADFIAGLQWVVANRGTYGIEAVNVSLGAPGCSRGDDAASTAVENAYAAGLVVVVAAGNDGPRACTIGTPAAARDALTVGAMSDLSEGGFALAAFSSRGPTFDGRTKPDVSAPGVAITSAWSSAVTGSTAGYATASGTSMAAPFVTGVALLMLDANPMLTPGDVKSRMKATTVDWGPSGADPEYGAGRLDAYAAVTAAGAPLASPPPVPSHVSLGGGIGVAGGSVEYRLPVTDTQFPLAVTLISPSPSFDLLLLDPGGAPVAFGSQSSRQGALTYHPTQTGPYTVRIGAARGAGDFAVDVSGGFGPAPLPTPQTGVASVDHVRPVVTALVARGVHGRPLKLRYRIKEDSRRTSERVTITRHGRLLRSLSRRLATREPGRTYYVVWRVPHTLKGRVRFCVQARDAARNASLVRCAAIRIR
jgi:serine protease AprX